MILNGTEDLRVIKTIEGIKAAFEELICEKDYEKITVKELCDRARINKKTFYHYYETLDFLLLELQTELSSGYIERIKDYTLPDEFDKVNREFYLFSAEQGLAYEKITCNVGNYSTIRQDMVDKVQEATWKKSKAYMSLDKPMQNLLITYVNTVSIGLYRQWVEDGKKVPMEEMIEISNAFMYNGVREFLRTRR